MQLRLWESPAFLWRNFDELFSVNFLLYWMDANNRNGHQKMDLPLLLITEALIDTVRNPFQATCFHPDNKVKPSLPSLIDKQWQAELLRDREK